MDIKSPRKVAGVLQALLEGHRVRIDNEVWCLGEVTFNGYPTFDLCVVGSKLDTGTGQTSEALLRSHIGLGDFIKLADRVTEKEWAILAAAQTITKLRQEAHRG